MKSCASYEQLMADVLFGTPEAAATAAARARLEAHLAACSDCARAFAELRATLSVASRRVRPEPAPEYWEGYYDRLAARLDAPPRAASRPPRPPGRRPPALQRTARIVLAVFLVAAGVVIGRFLPSPGSVSEPLPAATTTLTQAREDLLHRQAQRYLNRSKVLLLGLVNTEPGVAGTAGLDLPRQRRIARELVGEAGGLREALVASEQARLSDLVADLELILLQIANLEAEDDLPALELVRSGVDARGILLKINLTEMRMAEPPPALQPALEQRVLSERPTSPEPSTLPPDHE